MTHKNTLLSSAQLQIIAQWLVAVANKEKTRGEELDANGATELLEDLLGTSITFAILRGLTGDMVVTELRSRNIRLPQNATAIFSDFARKWAPEVPHCPSKTCGLPALRPLDDKSGVEVLPEGAICPWCDKRNVRGGESQAALINWATGLAVPPTQQYDDTTVPGTRLPLQEEELMGTAREGLRKLLQAHEVPAHAWLRYMLTQEQAFQAFGVPKVPMRVLASLENDSVMSCGHQLVNAQIMAAKRWIEGGGMKPRGGGGATQVDAKLLRISPRAKSRRTWLEHDRIGELHRAAIDAGLGSELASLLDGMHPSFAASIPRSSMPAAALSTQLHSVNQTVYLTDDSIPLAIWLANACTLTTGRPEAAVFQRALDDIRQLAQ